MRNLLLLSLLTVVFSLGPSQITYAVCMQVGLTPLWGNIIDCPAPIQNGPLNDVTVPNTTPVGDEVNIPPGGGLSVVIFTAISTLDGDDIVNTSGDVTSANVTAISTSLGNDRVVVDGGNLTGGINTISTGADDDTVIVNAGNLIGAFDAIFTNGGNDSITINGGFLEAGNHPLSSGTGNDNVTVNDGTLQSVDPQAVIITDSGNDSVNLNGGTYLKGSDNVVDLGADNDVLTFGGDIELDGFVECGEGFDTLVFAMDVRIDAVATITAQIQSKNPAGDSIVINEINYEWQNCEMLVPDLNGVPIVSTVPTLSEWGLISLAAVMGILGIVFYRRRFVQV